MDSTLFMTGTVTYAIKGRDNLRRNGFKATVERLAPSGKHGCGYGIRVYGNAAEAEKLLRNSGVKILEIKN